MNQAFEPACTPIAPPWEAPQVIPAQLRRVNNLIFRKIGQIARTNGVEAVTPMHGWIMEYLYRHSETPVFPPQAAGPHRKRPPVPRGHHAGLPPDR